MRRYGQLLLIVLIASRGWLEPNVTNEGSLNREFHADSESAIRSAIRGLEREICRRFIDEGKPLLQTWALLPQRILGTWARDNKKKNTRNVSERWLFLYGVSKVYENIITHIYMTNVAFEVNVLLGVREPLSQTILVTISVTCITRFVMESLLKTTFK